MIIGAKQLSLVEFLPLMINEIHQKKLENMHTKDDDRKLKKEDKTVNNKVIQKETNIKTKTYPGLCTVVCKC